MLLVFYVYVWYIGLWMHLHIKMWQILLVKIQKYAFNDSFAVADPGFPVGGGVDLVRGAVDPRGGYVSKILHVKTKESGPVGGGARRARPP